MTKLQKEITELIKIGKNLDNDKRYKSNLNLLFYLEESLKNEIPDDLISEIIYNVTINISISISFEDGMLLEELIKVFANRIVDTYNEAIKKGYEPRGYVLNLAKEIELKIS